jgi:hypothetical protein
MEGVLVLVRLEQSSHACPVLIEWQIARDDYPRGGSPGANRRLAILPPLGELAG